MDQTITVSNRRPTNQETHQSQMEARRLELEATFRPTGWKTIRKELFAHIHDPQITIRPDCVYFNASCISKLEDVIFIHFHYNEDLKRIAVEGCDENDRDALRWCIPKEDKRKTRRMICRPLTKELYSRMGWDPKKYYKILGYRIEYEGSYMFIFDLTVAEIKDMPKGKNKDADKNELAITYEVSEDVISSFGVSFEDHRKESIYSDIDGYVSVGLLNG